MNLATKLVEILKELLEAEKRRIVDSEEEQCDQLRHLIERREKQLSDDLELDHQFKIYISNLPDAEHPSNKPEEYRLYGDWEINLRDELDSWKGRLSELTNRSSDRRLIFDSAQDKAMRLLKIAAQSLDLLPHGTNDLLSSSRSTDKMAKSKKNDHIQDYVMPVVELMTREGRTHNDAFRVIANRLNVNITTVQAQCTRALMINTKQFVDSVANGNIADVIRKKYPDRYR